MRLSVARNALSHAISSRCSQVIPERRHTVVYLSRHLVLGIYNSKLSYLRLECRSGQSPSLNVFAFLLFAASCGVQTPMNRSSHSSSSCESNSSSSSFTVGIRSGGTASELFRRGLAAILPLRLMLICSSSSASSFSHVLLLQTRLVSRMNLPTLYLWLSSSAATYFQPRTLPH